MKTLRETIYRCDNCRRSVTNRRHARLLIGFTSGWMVPPFIGGLPLRSLAERNPEFHFCKPECAGEYITKKLHEIGTDTRLDAYKNRIAPISWDVLEALGLARSRMRREDNVGTRNNLQRSESERSVGDSVSVREGSLSGRFPRPRDTRQENQRVDRHQSDDGSGRKEISTVQLGATPGISEWIVRTFEAIRHKVTS